MLSVLSIFLTFLIIYPFALWLDPSFSLLSSRGIGKIAFVFIVIFQILLLLLVLPQKFLNLFLKTNLYFFVKKTWFKKFFTYFLLFFTLHSLVLLFLWGLGYINYNPEWGNLSFNLFLRIFWGFIVAFLLAWTEELIFRGTVYLYFVQHLKPVCSLFIASTIFMIAHNICDTLNIKLGIGLFLLGMMLNLIFIKTKKLYTGMGAHAGLVFVKVILRRVPFLTFLPATQLPFWISKDLRTSPLAHLLFTLVIIVLIYQNRKKLL